MTYKATKVGQITEKNNRPQIVTILYIVLMFQIDDACFQRLEANANFSEKVKQELIIEMRNPNVTWRIIWHVYLFTYCHWK